MCPSKPILFIKKNLCNIRPSANTLRMEQTRGIGKFWVQSELAKEWGLWQHVSESYGVNITLISS